MARRRRLDPPSADQLRKIEEGMGHPSPRFGSAGTLPPIATVAGEAAAQTALGDAGARADMARDSADAERYRQAVAAGMIVQDIPLSEIAADALWRDRISAHGEEMDELKASIAAHGLRLPIEIFERPASGGGGTERYGLISGWRRLMAVRALYGETGEDRFRHIRAILRQPDTAGTAYVAMVEENEIRSDLSHYERGRIAMVAAEQGVFNNVEQAVNSLYHTASKAKRSKIRSFAELHFELGDLLGFPTHLTERQGLLVVAAIRSGHVDALRRALQGSTATDPATEWALLEAAVTRVERAAQEATSGDSTTRTNRGGRPRRRGITNAERHTLPSGIILTCERDDRGHFIRIDGQEVNSDLVRTVLLEIKRLLEPA